MPNIKSAKKRVKVIEAKTLQNKAQKSALKTLVKKAELSLADAKADSTEIVREAIKRIDQAAAKGILHKNAASRKKSALASKLARERPSQTLRRTEKAVRLLFWRQKQKPAP